MTLHLAMTGVVPATQCNSSELAAWIAEVKPGNDVIP